MRFVSSALVFALLLSGSANAQTAHCDGGMQSALGGSNRIYGQVNAYAMFDDGSGSGPFLYAGGDLRSVDGESGSALARWDGTR